MNIPRDSWNIAKVTRPSIQKPEADVSYVVGTSPLNYQRHSCLIGWIGLYELLSVVWGETEWLLCNLPLPS